jgi:hypothetical protein
MASPEFAPATSNLPSPADPLVAALIGGLKWGAGPGAGADLTYSFPWTTHPTAVFAGAFGNPYSNLSEPSAPEHHGLNGAQIAAVRLALAGWAEVANLRFTEIAESDSSVGDLRVAWTSAANGNAWGWAYYPSGAYPSGGDIWLSTSAADDTNWLPGSGNFDGLLHEVGHALGLKHPFSAGVTLPASMNNKQYTVMAYDAAPHGWFGRLTISDSSQSYRIFPVNPETPMVLDVAAIQHAYGANTTTRTGNDVYTFDPATPFLRTLWDAGGDDTISVANFSRGCAIDLRPGSFSDIAIPSDPVPGWWTNSFLPTYDGTQNLGIAYGVNIENAWGGSGADVLQGNQLGNRLQGNAGADTLRGDAGRDTLEGGTGNDTLQGGSGTDAAVFSGPRGSYVVTRSGSTITVSGPDGVDHLTTLEHLVFSDSRMVLRGPVDVNGDAVSDLVWRNLQTGGGVIWPSANGNSGSAFGWTPDLTWQVIGFADFDGDSVADILWNQTGTNASRLWLGADSADQRLLAAQVDGYKVVGIGDFDGDGRADILWRHMATGSNAIWRAGDSTNLQAVTALADLSFKVAAVGDFDGDGRADILWRNSGVGTNVVWRGGDSTALLTLTSVADPSWQVAGVADLNGDGKSDLVWRHLTGGYNRVWLGGDSAQGRQITDVNDPNWKLVATGDYNGDGFDDLMWRNTSTGSHTIWQGGTSATAQALAPVADPAWAIQGQNGTWLAEQPTRKVAYDFDFDGKSDILWNNTSTGANIIWKGGVSATQQVVGSVADTSWKIAGIGDFDGDGKADLLWRNATNGSNAIWKGANGGNVQSLSPTTTDWKVAGVGDFDGDGKSDILFRNTSTGANAIWKSGSSATSQAVSQISDQNWKVAGIGDFDGDGKSDILWRNSSTGAGNIWKGGNSATSQGVGQVADPNWKIAAVADFNGDGLSDMLWRNTSTGLNVLWHSANYNTSQTLTQANPNFVVAGAADYNADGKADLLWRNSTDGTMVYWSAGQSTQAVTLTGVADPNWQTADQAGVWLLANGTYSI